MSNKSRVPILAAALRDALKPLPPEAAVTLLFTILLGREPDENGLQYYMNRYENGPADQLAVIHELSRSEEAARYGLFEGSDPKISSGILDLPSIIPLAFASLGLACRRLAELSERMEKFEELASLTLLTIPELCGHAYDGLDERLKVLEAQKVRRT